MSRNTFINTVLFFYERFRILLFNQILIDCTVFYFNTFYGISMK